MKNIKPVISVGLVCLFMILISVSCSGKKEARGNQDGRSSVPLTNTESYKGTITVSGAFALYPLMVRWGEEYGKANPEVVLEISAGGAGKGMADVLGDMVDIGMISREIYPPELEKGAWPLSVARDGVVGIFNKNSPVLDVLKTRGMTRDAIRSLWIEGTWGAGETGGFSPHVYTRSDACGAGAVWAEFMGAKQEDLQGIGVFGDPGIVEAVKADILGVGYGNVNFVYDAKTLKPVDGIAVLPIDLNRDGNLSEDERIYDTRAVLTAAIAQGVYPSPPSRSLFIVMNGKPTNPLLINFLVWILSEGQNFVEESGYIKLPEARITNQKELLTK